MAKRLTEVFKTYDGKFFETLVEAETHENMERMLQAIQQARADARHGEFGPTPPWCFESRLAEELVRQGFVFGGRK